MKRKLVALIASLSMLTLVTACGAKEEPADPGTETPGAEEPEEEPTEEPMSTELQVMFSGTPQVHEKEYLMNDFFKGFEEEFNVKVNVDFLTQEDGIRKIDSEQSTGNIVSDIVYADTANMSPYVNGGWMEDLTPIVEKTGSTYTNMFDGSTNVDDARYFVPNTYDVYILIANRKALDYLPDGVTEEDVVAGITWEQYAEWAVAIAEGEGQGKTMMPANMTGSQLLYPMAGMTLAYGGGFPEFTSDGFKSAMGIMAEIAAGNGFYAEQDQYTAPTEPLNSGDVWLTFAHMAPVGTSYNASPNSYVIGAAPKGSDGAGSTSGAWAWGIQKDAPHKDLAEKFIEYVARPDVNYDYCTNFGGALSPIEEVGEILESSDVVMRAGIEMLQTTKVTGVPATEYSDWNAVKILYGNAFDEMLNAKSVPSDEFLQDLQDQLEALKIK